MLTYIKASALRRRNHGSGSDTEASGTERARPKIRLGGVATSAAGSRDISPANSVPGSRASSPPRTGAFPSADEVRAAIPAQGISVQDMLKQFRGRVPREENLAFIKLVKTVGRNAPGDKTLIVRR